MGPATSALCWQLTRKKHSSISEGGFSVFLECAPGITWRLPTTQQRQLRRFGSTLPLNGSRSEPEERAQMTVSPKLGGGLRLSPRGDISWGVCANQERRPWLKRSAGLLTFAVVSISGDWTLPLLPYFRTGPASNAIHNQTQLAPHSIRQGFCGETRDPFP